MINVSMSGATTIMVATMARDHSGLLSVVFKIVIL